jgi:hypothetical protein
MSRRSLVGWGILGLVVFGPSFAIGYRHRTAGVYVEITNNTDSPLTQIDISYTGGVVRIPELKSKTSFGRRINPDGDSHLVVEWIDSSGQKHSSPVDVYFEHNYRGRIDISVEPDNTILSNDTIKLPVW